MGIPISRKKMIHIEIGPQIKFIPVQLIGISPVQKCYGKLKGIISQISEQKMIKIISNSFTS